MTVESARTDGSTVHVTWKSGAGRSWTQAYAADAPITLKRRLPGAVDAVALPAGRRGSAAAPGRARR